jgi:hypothetical protein
MFHANRARKGAANPISGGTWPQAARGSGFRSGLLVFTVAVLALLGGAQAGTAAATTQAAAAPQTEPSTSAPTGPAERVVEPTQPTQPSTTPDQRADQAPLRQARPPVELRLDPTNARVAPGEPQEYKATLWVLAGRYQFPLPVTGLAGFVIDNRREGCTRVRGRVSCSATRPGLHTVTGTLPARAVPQVSIKVVGTATLEVMQPDHLVLAPIDTTIELGESVTYTARAVAGNEDLRDMTGQTDFSMRLAGQPPAACHGAICTPTEVGDYTVTGTLKDLPTVKGSAILHVRPPPDHLVLDPREQTIELGRSQTYTAQAAAKNDELLGDVTGRTVFSLRLEGQPPTACQGATCTPTEKGDYTVTGRATVGDRTLEGTAILHVVKPPHHLELRPGERTIRLGDSLTYEAWTVAEDGERLAKVTERTLFQLTPSGSCKEATCTPTREGDHTVTGTLKDKPTVKGIATLHVEPPPDPVDHLVLEPSEQTIRPGPSVKGVTYTARALAKSKKDLGDVTGQTVFTISQRGRPSGTCTAATCTPATDGDHLVTGALKDKPTVKGTAVLHVKRELPRISSVTPSQTAAGKPVEVSGTTGSCNHAGTLTFHGIPNQVEVNVTGNERGDFVANFTVPTGTYPLVQKLELVVDCGGRRQRAEGELTVVNLAPVAVDDAASTTQDTAVTIAVTANDQNPDPDAGYQTVVAERGSPPNGTIQVQPDGTIVYSPTRGFVGQDHFQYGLCDNVINAAGTADCGIATVIVTVSPGTPTTSTTSTTGPPASTSSTSGSTTTTTTTSGRCAPTVRDLREHLQVTPVKGPGGTKLRVTARVDRSLAACPLRLLLGGTPLGPDPSVGPDGGIAANLPVPADALPGSSVLLLATPGGQVLDQTSFEILARLLPPWWQRDPYRLLLGVGALLFGALARAGVRRVRRLLQEQDRHDQARRYGLRAEPHTRPHEVTVAPDIEDRPTLAVRLQPHGDAGTLTLKELPG